MGKKLLLSLLVLVLSLAGAEGAMRVWLRVRGTPFDPVAERAELEAARSAVLGNFSGKADDPVGRAGKRGNRTHTVHPYFAYDKPSGSKQLERDLARGERADPGRYAVLVLGGSVAAGFGFMGSDRLVEILSRDPGLEGRKIEVLGYGVSTFKQPQQLLQLAYLFSMGIKVDAVINLDGFNEVAIGNGNAAYGIHPAYPWHPEWLRMATDWTDDSECMGYAVRMHELKQRIVSRADGALRSPLRWSALYLRRRSAEVGRMRVETIECQGALVARAQGLVPLEDRNVTGPRFDGEGQAPIEIAVRTWMESSLSIQSLCATRGVKYLHVLQPTLLDEGSKQPTPEETASSEVGPHWVRGVEVGYPLLRRSGRELRKRGVDFLDASGVFRSVEARIYKDACHFDQLGNEILAEAVGQAFLATL